MKSLSSILGHLKLIGCALRSILVGSSLFLFACTTYQAPVSERGTVVERTPPLILSTTGANTSPGRSAPASSSSTGTTATSTRPAIAGAATVAITPTRSGIARSSIDRSAISREPITGISASSDTDTVTGSSTSAPLTVPVSQAPASVSAPSASAVSANPASVSTHVVEQGETLYSIAFRYDIDFRRLALANNLQPPYTIFPNQRLSLNQSGISENAVSALPVIPASPAGESVTSQGQPSRLAAENRRRESVPVRQVDEVQWQWPVLGRVMRNFVSSGGDISGRGIDIVGKRGDAVYAAADGDVVYAGRGIQGAGDLIIIRHGARLLSAYMYNSAMLVSEGARINAGDKIAEIGSDITGQELLHFEVRLDGKPVDPLAYLPTP
jgi:lipoprotein NlpD